MNHFNLPGKVFLIGAGPGSAGLLTLHAAELLKQADLILHDELVSSEVLDLIPARTAVLNVGKRCGRRGMPQGEINQKMITAAEHGQMVVRLKGGDSLIFGRLQEEMGALRAAGIDFEIVPGVTAASAAAAAAKIPLTDRNVASKVVFVSNHSCAGKARDWHCGVTSDATLVFYMPGSAPDELVGELTSSGLSPDTPCLVISNVARPEQEIVRTKIRDLAQQPALPSPRLLIVGELAAAPKSAPAGKEGSIELAVDAASRDNEMLLDWEEKKIDDAKIQDDAVTV